MSGEFIVDVPEGTQLRATFVGYEPTVFTGTDTPTAKVLMKWGSELLPEFEVTADRKRKGGWLIIGALLLALAVSEDNS